MKLVRDNTGKFDKHAPNKAGTFKSQEQFKAWREKRKPKDDGPKAA